MFYYYLFISVFLGLAIILINLNKITVIEFYEFKIY
jgi:hypothetical protein